MSPAMRRRDLVAALVPASDSEWEPDESGPVSSSPNAYYGSSAATSDARPSPLRFFLYLLGFCAAAALGIELGRSIETAHRTGAFVRSWRAVVESSSDVLDLLVSQEDDIDGGASDGPRGSRRTKRDRSGPPESPLFKVDDSGLLAAASRLPMTLVAGQESRVAATALTRGTTSVGTAPQLRRSSLPLVPLVQEPRADEAVARQLPTTCTAGRRYIVLLSVREGMSAWSHAVLEVLSTAALLNRTLVLPCVAGGVIVPCVPGRVLPVPEGMQALPLRRADEPPLIDAYRDPLAVPAFGEMCGVKTATVRASGGRAYPLSLYLDVAALRRVYPALIDFDEWAACELGARRDEAPRRAKAREVVVEKWSSDGTAALRVRGPLVYCVTRHGVAPAHSRGGDNGCRNPVGPYVFDSVWRPPNASDAVAVAAATRQEDSAVLDDAHNAYAAHMLRLHRRTLEADTLTTMFFTNVWRGSFRVFGTYRTPPFNTIHAASVLAWLRHTLDLPSRGMSSKKGAPFVAFQWRTEEVPEERLPGCASRLTKAARVLMDAIATPTSVPVIALTADSSRRKPTDNRPSHRGVLISDLPGPSNPCRMWRTYRLSQPRSQAAQGSTVDVGRAAAAAAMTTTAPNRTTEADSQVRRKAVARLMHAGLAKYDEDHPMVDAGVLSIRDWLLATSAETYVTCSQSAAACGNCFRAQSKFVRRILEARARAGRRRVVEWISTTRIDGTHRNGSLQSVAATKRVKTHARQRSAAPVSGRP